MAADEDNGALAEPRTALPFNWMEESDFHEFDSYERGFAHQIEQHLAALGQEKALILLNFLAKTPPYGLE